MYNQALEFLCDEATVDELYKEEVSKGLIETMIETVRHGIIDS